MSNDPVDELDIINDDEFAKDLGAKVKADQFAAGLPYVYQEDDDMDCEWYILEYSDGTKKRVHASDLAKQ